MLSIILQRTINCPTETVWQVINDTHEYGNWNPFILACDSSFEPGTPIIMKVKLLGGITIKQKETIFENNGSSFCSYGINLPLNFLSSTRHHKLSSDANGNTVYESFFELRGFFSPIVKLFMVGSLRKGFTGMTDGIATEAMRIHQQTSAQA